MHFQFLSGCTASAKYVAFPIDQRIHVTKAYSMPAHREGDEFVFSLILPPQDQWRYPSDSRMQRKGYLDVYAPNLKRELMIQWIWINMNSPMAKNTLVACPFHTTDGRDAWLKISTGYGITADELKINPDIVEEKRAFIDSMLQPIWDTLEIMPGASQFKSRPLESRLHDSRRAWSYFFEACHERRVSPLEFTHWARHKKINGVHRTPHMRVLGCVKFSSMRY